MANLDVIGVSHAFGTKRVLHNVNLQVTAGQFVALVGPSGCGKSTLLRAILGTHPPEQGEIRVGGNLVNEPNRDVGIVYQHYSLYPFLTASQNVAFGLMLDQTSFPYRLFRPFQWRRLKKSHLKQAEALLVKVGLAKAIHSYPHEMSGGMCQRVAIAQALIMNPKILLLDEPFGALDEATRENLQMMLLHLYDENLQAQRKREPPPYTIVIVTHELNEAIFVADRIVGLSQYHSEGQLGSTIVYDKAAPVYLPTDVKDLAHFVEQKQELLAAVFDEKSQRHFSEYVSFWRDRDKTLIAPVDDAAHAASSQPHRESPPTPSTPVLGQQ